MSWLQLGEDLLAELPDGRTLGYRRYGPENRPAVVLLAGLGMQLISWPPRLVLALREAGFQVLLLDNRDVGLSFRVNGNPPGKWQQLRGLAPSNAYALENMAQDTADFLTHLKIPTAHVVGMSMGGMIAQCLAAQQPNKVLSLTSIFSTTGARSVGQPAFSTLLRLSRPAPRNVAHAKRRHVSMMRHIGDPHVPGIEFEWRTYTEQAWLRNGNNANAGGIGRQIGAILRSGDRTQQLRRIQAPTLVIHGAKDLMVHPSGGHATAAAIAGAQLVILENLRHQLDDLRIEEMLEPILKMLTAHSA